MALDIGEFMENVSEVWEGTKDVVSDAVSDMGELVSDVGDITREAMESVKDVVLEALEKGDVREAIEKSDVPEEAKEAMQETSKAFGLDINRDGKDIVRFGVGIIGTAAGIGIGSSSLVALGNYQMLKSGINIWQSVSQVSNHYNDPQMYKMIQSK